MNNNAWGEVHETIKKVSAALLNEDNRKCISQSTLEEMVAILHKAASVVKKETDSYVISAITECFRALRNSCVGQKATQNIIIKNTSALDDTCSILGTLSSLPVETSHASCIQIGVQFWGNSVVNNTENQKLVWSKCSAMLLNLLSYKDEKVANYSSMVMYNILLGCPDLSMDQGTQLLEILIDHAMMDSEYALFTVELLLARDGYLQTVYNELKGERKLFLLEAIHSMLSSNEEKSTLHKVPVSSVVYLAQQFKTRSDCILKTIEHYAEQLEPMEVAKLLELIASASSNNPYLQELQKDKSLLINCAFLLRNIHTLGKSSENSFSTVQKLSALSLQGDQREIQQHPAFGFKGSLIRLLGNLCWKHKENQDQVRELDCIPILLDCCNIDARNPLIIQWVVLACRNLCEGNKDNQAVIASMTKLGTIDSSVLRELGITLHDDGEKKIGILPLSK
ncbi:ataxin-10 [Anabrus simplex]|uniref:ataxin-10 n=1 Tax=Anabrus simplex TaxID=316456 RepID=UPI0035A2BD17